MAAHVSGLGCQVPPSCKQAEVYFIQKGHSAETAKEFHQYYSQKNWLNPKGKLIADWKRCAWQWIWNR